MELAVFVIFYYSCVLVINTAQRKASNQRFVIKLKICYLWAKEHTMPKIFEYLGILVFFYSNEHEPYTYMVNMMNLKVRLSFIL